MSADRGALLAALNATARRWGWVPWSADTSNEEVTVTYRPAEPPDPPHPFEIEPEDQSL